MAVRRRFTEQVITLVTPETRQRLDQLADERGVSVAQVVRECIRQSLEQQEEEPGQK